MKANFLPQQLVLHLSRVYINGQQISQAIAHSYILVVALLTLTVWAKPIANPVKHISYNPVSEGNITRQISKTKHNKIAKLSRLTTSQTQVKQSSLKVSSNLGNGFALIKACESGGNYHAINSAGYYGAYQFNVGTWNSTAKSAGRADLVGVRPDQASPADQDAMAKKLHSLRGWQPWGCAYHVGLL